MAQHCAIVRTVSIRRIEGRGDGTHRQHHLYDMEVFSALVNHQDDGFFYPYIELYKGLKPSEEVWNQEEGRRPEGLIDYDAGGDDGVGNIENVDVPSEGLVVGDERDYGDSSSNTVTILYHQGQLIVWAS